MKHIVADISGHGFGHLGQAAPVLNSLRDSTPNIRLTVRTSLPETTVARRLSMPFQYRHVALDVGMRMHDAMRVDVPASAAQYRAFHSDWATRVRAAADELMALSPDLVLSNVPYLGLAAAARANIASIALCCLNWADIYWHFCQDQPEAARIHQQILEAYRTATVFLTPVPTMPMLGLANTRKLDPVGQRGRNRRRQLNELLGLRPHDKLILISFGGISFDLPMDAWPPADGLHFIVPAAAQPTRPGFGIQESTGFPYVDLIASCDALITKPGYASFVESALCGTPLLYVRRNDWPEQDCLIEWLQSRGHCRELSESQVRSGAFVEQVNHICSEGRAAPLEPNGIDAAVQCILEVLQTRGAKNF